eukprot:CAMPEP_0185588564 /NCGR_PEP_ID=MMETSP0434-20130131/53625_1 /TAXON_ID=626734 ORGANISM="Favella taraikaensis, Strain Fe Narragansett Bay" /NCGR_SAMPLE_ID=MMETSP0434 /ASSEMBLY_ACC=CAM_ASM_000379 /LENGTH=64 /DNA_ID=CAMNT_0028211341 /DNA_START=481 /DNA_END=675 /DNA_ORIENTATION=+
MVRYKRELEEAKEMLAEVEELDYEELRAAAAAKKGGAVEIQARKTDFTSTGTGKKPMKTAAQKE